jgi:hypothetical protein
MDSDRTKQTRGLILHDRFRIAGQSTAPQGAGRRAGLTEAQLTRFRARVPSHLSGCQPWQGYRLKAGYGMLNTGPQPDGKHGLRYAHRLAWELANGRRLRDGEVVRHTCDNPPCCNPAHLLVGTQADNIEDAAAQGKYRVAARRRWHNPDRHQLIQSLLSAPRGTMRRVASERGINYGTLAVAVCRARKAVTHG